MLYVTKNSLEDSRQNIMLNLQNRILHFISIFFHPENNNNLYRIKHIPAETRGQSGSMDSTDVSSGSELETQLQQFCNVTETIFC